MYCPQCGYEIKEKVKYCPNCSFQIGNIYPFLNQEGTAAKSVGSTVLKAYSVEEIRKKYRRAYEKWSKNEEEELICDYKGGLTISQLAQKHQRKEGAIKSRLVKLGLLT